jgi:predicted ATPase
MARLDRLPGGKDLAQLGAVLGREFPYALLHAMASVDEATLQARLAHLVAAELLYQRGRPPHARYLFKHALIQDAAYQSLLKSRRQQEHQRVAELLRAQFPDTAETQPELVAQHYTEAGLPEQALPYWQQAGERAARRFAQAEAISHFRRGLEVLASLPYTPTRDQHELVLQTSLGPVLMMAKGFADQEVGYAYARARTLCQQVGATPQLFPVLWGLYAFYLVRAEFFTARELAEQCLSLAQDTNEPALLVEAHYAKGALLYLFGAFVEARTHLEQSMTLYDPQQHGALGALYGGQNPAVWCRTYMTFILWLLGYPEQAFRMSQEALALAETLSSPFDLGVAQDNMARLYQHCRDVHATRKWNEVTRIAAAEQGFVLRLARCTGMQGWVLVQQGQVDTGLEQIRRSLDAQRATGAEHLRPHYLAWLAEAYRIAAQPEAGLDVLAEALTLVTNTAGRVYEAEIHRLRGELLLRQATPDTAQAEACFHQALDIGRQQQAKSWELRVATSLARLW